MGVLNVTPDSFSDGGLYAATDAAIAHGHALLAQGADVLDVGGESSRPGAAPVALDEELARVVPVIEALAGEAAGRGAVRLSVDTVKAEVAWAAVAAGASLVNDISASLWEVAAATGAGWVAMHMQGVPRTMQEDPRYDDVVEEVYALRAGAGPPSPRGGGGRGLGRPGHRLRQDDRAQPVPAAPPRRAGGGGGRRGCAGVVVGTSRKGFLGVLAAGAGGAGGSRRPWPSGRRAPWPRRPQPWWPVRGWCGSTTWRPRSSWPGCMVLPHEGQVGSRDPAAQLHLGDQGPPGRQ